MFNEKQHKMERKIYIGFSAFLFLYIALRSVFALPAHDEIATFYYYISQGEFLPYQAHWDANNHILNSALSSLFYSLFGAHTFVFRLANLLFLPVFFVFNYLIAQKIKKPYLRLLLLFVLPLVHNFLEFYGASRGYAMSFSLIWMAVYYLMKANERPQLLYYIAALLAASLAVLANMALLNSLLIVFVLLLFLFFRQVKNCSLRQIFLYASVFIFIGLVPVLFFVSLSLKMKELGLLYYGELDGFWTLTVRSLLRLLVNNYQLLPQTLAALLFGIALFFFAKQLIRNKVWGILFDQRMIFPILFFGNVVAVLLMAIIMEVNYPEDRVALYLFLFLFPALLFLLDVESNRFSRIAGVFVLLVFCAFPLHFIAVANMAHLIHYKEDAFPPRFYDTIREESLKSGQLPTIGGYRQREMVWAFYDYQHDGSQNPIHKSNYPGVDADFQIICPDSLPQWRTYYDSIDYFAPSNRMLLRRKHFLQRHEIQNHTAHNILNEDRQYFNLYSGRIENLHGEGLYVEVEAEIQSEAVPFNAWLVVELRNAADKSIGYERLMLDWKKKEWNERTAHAKYGFVFPEIPDEADKMIVYLWNIRQVNCSIENTHVRLCKLERDFH